MRVLNAAREPPGVQKDTSAGVPPRVNLVTESAPSAGQNAGDDLTAVAPVDAEVGVGRQHHGIGECLAHADQTGDRKSTRLNSSHITISYAVFCLKKKKNQA